MSRVSLRLGGDQIAMEQFMAAIRAFVRLLTSADMSIHGERLIAWRLAELHRDSPATIVSEGLPAAPNRIDPTPGFIGSILNGLESMENTSMVPREFPDISLQYVKELAGLRGHGGITDIRISASNGLPDAVRVVPITQRSAATIEDTIGGKYKAIGSVEGRLDGINIHGRQWRLEVYEPVHDKKVRCHFSPQLLELAKAAIGSRVLVIGEVVTNSRGHPVSVTVSKMETLRSRSELPQELDRILGPGESITPRGIDSTEFVRDRWGDDGDDEE